MSDDMKESFSPTKNEDLISEKNIEEAAAGKENIKEKYDDEKVKYVNGEENDNPTSNLVEQAAALDKNIKTINNVENGSNLIKCENDTVVVVKGKKNKSKSKKPKKQVPVTDKINIQSDNSNKDAIMKSGSLIVKDNKKKRQQSKQVVNKSQSNKENEQYHEKDVINIVKKNDGPQNSGMDDETFAVDKIDEIKTNEKTKINIEDNLVATINEKANFECANIKTDGQQNEEKIIMEEGCVESFKNNNIVDDEKDNGTIKHFEQQNCDEDKENSEKSDEQNKKNKRKQKKIDTEKNNFNKEEETEMSKIENISVKKENKKKKRKETSYVVETDFLFEIKENKKRKQRNNGSKAEEIVNKESVIPKNDYEEEAGCSNQDESKKKRKTLKDYIREKKSKTCTITTAIVKRLTPEEVAILTGIFPMEEPAEDQLIDEPLAAVAETSNDKLTSDASEVEEYPSEDSAAGEPKAIDNLSVDETVLSHSLVVQEGNTAEECKSDVVAETDTLVPTAPAELKPTERKDVILDVLLEDLHKKTANLAAGEKVVLFRSVLPKADILCLQGLKDRVSDADFLWANYYFTLKHMMGKKYSFLKGVLVHDGVCDKKYEPPAPRCSIYTQKTHCFDIVMEK